MAQFKSEGAEEKKKPTITHVIFDLDGTLIDSEEQYLKLHNECLRNYGKELSPKDKREMVGHPTRVQIKRILEIFDLKNESAYRKVSF
jgi:phosphoglycolate phosphatase-like HAD superfamily hydrolase